MTGEPDGTRDPAFSSARGAKRAFQDKLLIAELRQESLADHRKIGHADCVPLHRGGRVAIGMNTPHPQDGPVAILVRFPHHQQVPDRGDNPHGRDSVVRETGFENEPDIRPVPDRTHPGSIYLRDTQSGSKRRSLHNATRRQITAASVGLPTRRTNRLPPWDVPPTLDRTLDAALGPATIPPQPIDLSEGENIHE